jgi:hypothetical protein
MSDTSGFWMTVGLSGAAGLFAGVGTAITFGPDSESKFAREAEAFKNANPDYIRAGGRHRRTRRAKRHA